VAAGACCAGAVEAVVSSAGGETDRRLSGVDADELLPPCAHCGAYLDADDGPCSFCPGGVVRRRGDPPPSSDSGRHDDCTVAHNCGEHPEWEGPT
jgi:hypothetical protein